ncbi:NAD(P)-binding domain-containing protein [Rugosimonospora acidiphila]|uniref:NAD(P)-binding domain-containing protein n=1 Tax=Rugosimonospora acidiphila TaxID=556531 RepID=A0ABP9RP12_9ACTN
MRIGIIGAGHIGSTLARYFVSAGHDVAIANSRGPETLRELESSLGTKARAETPARAARFGELAVLSVPFGRYREAPAEELAGKPVVDATNYYPERDGRYPDLDSDSTTSSELVQRHLRDSRVVKAFNTIPWDTLQDTPRTGGEALLYGVPVAGDDDGAKRCVFDLIEEMGFQPVDSGGLAQGGRKQQPGSPVYGTELPANELLPRLS